MLALRLLRLRQERSGFLATIVDVNIDLVICDIDRLDFRVIFLWLLYRL